MLMKKETYDATMKEQKENIERNKMKKEDKNCANCGYSKAMHPIFISGRKVQEKGEIFLDWVCKEFVPQNKSTLDENTLFPIRQEEEEIGNKFENPELLEEQK